MCKIQRKKITKILKKSAHHEPVAKRILIFITRKKPIFYHSEKTFLKKRT